MIGTVVAILASRFHYHRALAVEYPAAGCATGSSPPARKPLVLAAVAPARG